MYEIDILLFLSAYLAGLLMFLAPCTLPMIPAYLGFISGLTSKELREKELGPHARKIILLNALYFSLGFSIVFILLGMLAGGLGSLLSGVVSIYELRIYLIKLGGFIILIFGLFLLGALRIPFLTKERRFSLPSFFTIGAPLTSLLLGAAFAFGWTPCVGPVYGTILYFAGSTEAVWTGALLLGAFSLGFATPLVGLAALISQATRLVEKAQQYLKTISAIGGVVLIIIGINALFGGSVLTDWFYNLMGYLDIQEVLYPYL